MDLTLKRTPGLFLVGFMASGKSTTGPLLARRLGWNFCDVDARIEREQGCTIRHIFEQQGEPAFRELETAAIRSCVDEIRQGHPHVVALGGGAFVQDSNWELIRNHGITVWLDCPLPRIRQRLALDDTRPLASKTDAIAGLYEARQQLYARANFRIDADCDDPGDVVRLIEELPIF